MSDVAGPEGFEPSLAVLETDVLTIDTMGLFAGEFYQLIKK